MTTATQLDVLTSAKYESQSIRLEFADGEAFSISPAALEVPVEQFRWPTVQITATGDAMTVDDLEGDAMPIDAATLRYLVDKDYAKFIDDKIERLHVPQKELQKMLPFCKPPKEWYDEDHTGIFE